MVVVMKGRRSCKIFWSIVEGIVSSGKVVGLQVKMTCRMSSVARLQNVPVKEKGNPDCVV